MIELLPVLNMLGGRGGVKFICRFVLMPLMVAMHVDFDLYISICAFACFAIWATFGHGKYFTSFHGRDNPNEEEIRWIDAIGYKLFKTDGITYTNTARGLVTMGIRGMFLYPYFLLMIPVNPYAPLIGLALMLQGVCYAVMRYAFEPKAVAGGELLTGLLLYLLLLLVHGI